MVTEMLLRNPGSVVYRTEANITPISMSLIPGITESIAGSKNINSLPMVKLGNEIVTDLPLQVRFRQLHPEESLQSKKTTKPLLTCFGDLAKPSSS